ncbi:macro domain-containing protein [Thiohalocapsa sp. ML1]|jgi:O-acetyl-ADP-ribose deacetylase (regulator of RNase III)|uniref:type II toxin-antitoxin system antitoxin DNA ADP-ribosyl glycohydrolase DarG n=1 Tax=Thiohalocapsa sp. ML1 TaxID=1431688 RepID=UPI0007321771|nr:macro domain-containing protein [Thiohalocapsa sp. ML1]
MIRYTQGNLLEADAEALVNTVNTVGVMGKGIALMFKERFPKNMEEYARACKAEQVQTGKMFVTETGELMGPRWIVNFPTKRHWRHPSKMEWISEGLEDLKAFIQRTGVQSIALPPLGSGNGGLDWAQVKREIEARLSELSDVHIVVYEPTHKYQNVAKAKGVQKLTPARALIAELIRRYWVLGMECSLLEIQKLAWFLERAIEAQGGDNPLDLRFTANNYGPYANRLDHLLNGLDGSYLKSDKRIPDATPLDVIWFDEAKRERVDTYLNSEAKPYLPALEQATAVIDGFESPFGMELLATVDWLLVREGCAPDLDAVMEGIAHWPAGEKWAARKVKLFDRRSVGIALQRLTTAGA